MDFYENRYYNFTRICLSLVGLWPYTESKTRFVRTFIVYLNICCIFTLQIAKIITTNHKINTLLEITPDLLICIAGVLMYTNNSLNRSKLYELLELVKQEWREKRDTKEFEIMKKYAEDSRKYSIMMITIYYGTIFLLTCISIVPPCLDVIYPLNETRPRKLPFSIEFFLDEEKHFYSMLLMSLVMAMILGVSVISNCNIFLLFLQHLCGMFIVAGNMIDSVFKDKHCSEAEAYIKVVRSIKYHKQTLEFEEFLRVTYQRIYLLLVLIGLCLMCITFLQLVHKITQEVGDLSDSTISIVIFISSTIIVYLNCYFGQKIIDHSTFLFSKAFSAPWYLLTKKSQMLLWFMMTRSMKPCYLSLGKPFFVSIQFFASVSTT
ncbi:hypothetical protein KPH14_007670 [Odynerus spinipes]|uniref:Odorant receptor n=1 Tax=Odynerus spinipes TaxID=1348599 RepID=A0AAD9VNQ8_9HYME|nr:hypothetical protein KPH14_007670 [Odynerus spinipes]